MKPIAFTQYLRPDGRKVEVSIDMTDEVAEKAAHLQLAGYRLECEILSNGICSFTISDGEEDLLVNLCPNGGAVVKAVYQLVTDGYSELVEKRRKTEVAQ